MSKKHDKGKENSLEQAKHTPIDAEETRALQSSEPTENDIDDTIRKAFARMSNEAQEEDSDESSFLARIADPTYMANLPAFANANDGESSFEEIGLEQFPESVGNFEPIECLGAGGMGRVFKVRHRLLQQVRAVKLLHTYRVNNPQAIARFKNEIRALGSLDHPNIVAAQDAGVADDIPYLVMDFVDGFTLAQRLAQYKKTEQPFPIQEACDYVRQAAVGIQYAHDNGIVHRDIKPGNVVVDKLGNVKVLDLGLARIVDENIDHSRDLTTDQQVLGTPNYMAPEQLKSSRTADARADVYGLGATLYRLLTGEFVYPSIGNATFFEKATQITNDPVPDIRSLRPDIPGELADLVTNCLQKSPDDRVESAGELATRLALWSTTAPPSSSNESTATKKPLPSPASESWNPRKWMLILTGVLLPLILLAGFIIRLQLAGGGELVIECDDPNASFKIVAVQGDSKKDWEFNRDSDGSIVLNEGKWRIEIEGLDAAQYSLSKDLIVMSKGGEQRLRVTRVGPNAVIASGVDAAETIEPGSTIGSNPISNKEPLETNWHAELDWSPSEKKATIPGYASFPADLAGVGTDWQVIPTYPHYSSNFSISPKGTYVVAMHGSEFDPYYRILERRSGKLVGLYHQPGRHGRSVDWAPDESKLVICTWVAQSSERKVTICKPNGTVMEQWSTETKKIHGYAALNPDGSSILFVEDDTIELTTPTGQVIDAFEAPQHGGRVFNQHHDRPSSTWSPDGTRFAIATEGEIRVYEKSGKPIVTLKSAGENEIEFLEHIWHPDSNRIVTLDNATGDERAAARLWSLDGSFVRFGFATRFESIQSFSPDGQFFVSSHGGIYRTDAAHPTNDETHEIATPILQLDANEYQSDYGVASWVEQGRLILMTKHLGAGRSLDFSPLGTKIAESEFPIPLEQHAYKWDNDGQELQTVGGNQQNSWTFHWAAESLPRAAQKRSQAMSQWQDSVSGDSVKRAELGQSELLGIMVSEMTHYGAEDTSGDAVFRGTDGKPGWTGIGFDDGSQIRFGSGGLIDTPADSNRLITFVVPAGNGRLIPLTVEQFMMRVRMEAGQAQLLRVLDLGGSASTSDRSYSQTDASDAALLPPQADIIKIDLSGLAGMTDELLADIGLLTNLESLDISETSVTDQALAATKMLQKLRELNLAGTKVSDLGIANIPSGLVEIDLSGTSVSDLAIEELKRFKSLRRLRIRGTQISDKGNADLQASHPDCEISRD